MGGQIAINIRKHVEVAFHLQIKRKKDDGFQMAPLPHFCVQMPSKQRDNSFLLNNESNIGYMCS